MSKTLLITVALILAGLVAMAQERDMDGDGITDNTDDCPYVAGPAQYNGCPGMPLEVKPGMSPYIYFETGKADLSPAARRTLGKLINMCKKDPAIYVYLSGHCDINGGPSRNMQLSAERAKACRDYLEVRGVEASQLIAKGMGSTEPIADNGTAKGRQQNRYVSFKLKKYRR